MDAIGACVGNKGARVNAIVEELKVLFCRLRYTFRREPDRKATLTPRFVLCRFQRKRFWRAIVEELKGEKIDIIPWSDNPLEFIAKALSPAQVISVTQLEGEKMILSFTLYFSPGT